MGLGHSSGQMPPIDILFGHSDIVEYVFGPVCMVLLVGLALFLHAEQSQYVWSSLQIIVFVIVVQSGQSDVLGNVFT